MVASAAGGAGDDLARGMADVGRGRWRLRAPARSGGPGRTTRHPPARAPHGALGRGRHQRAGTGRARQWARPPRHPPLVLRRRRAPLPRPGPGRGRRPGAARPGQGPRHGVPAARAGGVGGGRQPALPVLAHAGGPARKGPHRPAARCRPPRCASPTPTRSAIPPAAPPAAPGPGAWSTSRSPARPPASTPGRPGSGSHRASSPTPTDPRPVIELIGGTPSWTSDWTRSARLDTIADQVAAAHDGEAPVLVMVDANGTAFGDTECVGRAESYLTIDVPTFMEAHFSVPAARERVGHRRILRRRHLRGDAGPAPPRPLRRLRRPRRRLPPRRGRSQPHGADPVRRLRDGVRRTRSRGAAGPRVLPGAGRVVRVAAAATAHLDGPPPAWPTRPAPPE